MTYVRLYGNSADQLYPAPTIATSSVDGRHMLHCCLERVLCCSVGCLESYSISR